MKAKLEEGRSFLALHSLNNFKTQKYYQIEPKFHVFYSTNNLLKIKEWAFVINFDEYKKIETHGIALNVNAENVTYFNGIGSEHIPKENKRFIASKNIKTNIYRIQAHKSIMCG